MPHVMGIWPVDRQVDTALVRHMASGLVAPPTCPIPPPKIVMTTSAVIRITMAETTTASVVFIADTYVQVGLLLLHVQLTCVLHSVGWPFTLTLQKAGSVPVTLQDVAKTEEQKDLASVSEPTLTMLLPNMVMTTRAVMSITIAETTTASVVFMLMYWLRAFINKGARSHSCHMAKINRVDFGEIVISGKSYFSDVSIDAKGRVEHLEKSHIFSISDVLPLLEGRPECIVIGTGMVGVVRFERNVAELLEQKGVALFAEKTPKAVMIFNGMAADRKKVAGIFHLTS